ncbi:serine/threonine protein kinase, partial [Streptomyces zaomyceticus]
PGPYRAPVPHTAPTAAAPTHAAQGHGYGPPHGPVPPSAYPYPGAPGGPGGPMPTGPGAPRSAAGRGLLVAVAAVLAFGAVGGVTAYALLKEKAETNASDSHKPSGPGGTTTSGTTGGTGGSSGTPSAKASAAADPAPADFGSINLTAGYHLTLGDDVVRPQDGEDGGYELSYDTGGYLDAESSGGSLVLLDPGQQGSLAVCRAETRFTQEVYVNKLTTGRQVCVTTGSGHLGLVTVKGISPEDSPSTYLTIDLTVWRNAAPSS